MSYASEPTRTTCSSRPARPGRGRPVELRSYRIVDGEIDRGGGPRALVGYDARRPDERYGRAVSGTRRTSWGSRRGSRTARLHEEHARLCHCRGPVERQLAPRCSAASSARRPAADAGNRAPSSTLLLRVCATPCVRSPRCPVRPGSPSRPDEWRSTVMAIEVRIPTILRTYTGGAKAVEGSGDTLARAASTTSRPRHPGICATASSTTAALRRFVNVYLNDEDVRFLGGLDDRRSPTATLVTILPGRRRWLDGAAMRFDSLLDSVGGTPLVGLPRLSPSPGRPALGQARGPQPDRLDQGPRRRSRWSRRPRTTAAAPGLHDPRADQRQHRHLAGDGGQAQGLPAGLRDAGEHLGRAPPAAAHVGRRDRLLARRRRLQRGRRGWPSSSPRSTPTG